MIAKRVTVNNVNSKDFELRNSLYNYFNAKEED